MVPDVPPGVSIPGAWGNGAAMSEPTMDAPPPALLDEVVAATARLLSTVDGLGEPALRGPSLLPGWSRAHVLTHLARGADSRVRLLDSARLGVPIRQYPDERTREREIEEGSARPRAAIVADLHVSADRLADAVASHPADRWGRPVLWLGDRERPVDGVVSSRIQELEMHHVDLAAGYRYGDWPRWFVAGAMPGVVHTMRDLADLTLDATDTGTLYRLRTGTARTVHGPLNALFAWLTGRSDGADLAVDPPGTLPEPPPWK